MKKNNIRVSIIVGIVGLSIGFVGGNIYGKNYSLKQNKNGYSMMQNGQGQFTRNIMGGSVPMRNGGAGGGIAGEVISKDDKSITIKLRDGGSKIVLFGDSVTVTNSVAGTFSDVATGSQVVVAGRTNTDGSVTATSIQIRP